MYLEAAIASTRQQTPLLLALRLADAVINDHVDEYLQSITDEIILGHNPDELKATARKYFVWLVEEASQETLIHAFAVLAESMDSQDQHCASEIFREVTARDIGEYSDDDLEIIRRFKGWPSEESYELDETETLVVDELRRRGLIG